MVDVKTLVLRHSTMGLCKERKPYLYVDRYLSRKTDRKIKRDHVYMETCAYVRRVDIACTPYSTSINELEKGEGNKRGCPIQEYYKLQE